MVSNYNVQYNVPMQAGVPVQMQGIDSEKLKHSVDNSYLANRARASEETNPLAMLGVGAGVWYALAQTMDKFNPKCEGKYEDSILGKWSQFGDKISTKTYLGRKFETMSRAWSKFTDKLASKSKIVYSLKHHSTSPEWSFAKTPGKGVLGFLAMDTEQVFEEFLYPIAEHPSEKVLIFPITPKYNSFIRLEQYGMKPDDIKAFEASLKGKTFSQKALALQEKELELLKVDKTLVRNTYASGGLEGLKNLAMNEKAKLLGFDSLAEYHALKGKMIDNPEKVIEVLKKGIERSKGKDLKISIWRSNGKIRNNLFGRKVALSEYLNKYKAVLGKEAHTKLGKLLPKMLSWFMEGCTNRFAGGKLAVVMQAGIFADMLINSFKAPKGEKGKTLIERFVNDFTYFIAMPFGIVAMHKVGGLKYAGLDKDGVIAYRQALAQFNENVRNKSFATKAEYKNARKALRDMLGKKNIKNPVTKLLQKLGAFINIGNEAELSYRSASKWNLNLLRKFGCKNIIGVPLRIIIPMMVISPFLAKLTTKCAHAIFGRPTKSVLDEEPEEETLQEPEHQPYSGQQTDIKPQEPFVSNNSPTNLLKPYRDAYEAEKNRPFVSNNSPTNLIRMHQSGNPYREAVPHIDEPQAQDVSENNQTKSDEPVRTYVPSPEGVVINNNADLSPVESALKRADAAEKLAMETLSMRG